MGKVKNQIVIKPVTVFIISSFMLLMIAIFHNINLLVMMELPMPAPDNRLSSHILQNEMSSGFKYEVFDRVNEGAVKKAFISICNEMYTGKSIKVKDNLFSKKILKEAGFNLLPGVTDEKFSNLNDQKILIPPKRSLFYNPFVFSSENYAKIRRYPLVSYPPFKREYPNTILFFELPENEETVTVKITKNFIIFSQEKL